MGTFSWPRTRSNSLDDKVALGLSRAIRSLGQTARCVVLGSEGRTFCAGGDFQHLLEMADTAPDRIRATISDCFQEIVRAVVSCPVPVIARVQGPAVGAGADLVLACDMAIATQRAWLRESWLDVGLTSALGGGLHLARVLGHGNAMEAFFTSRKIDASECLRLGIYQDVVDPGALNARVDALACAVAARGRDAIVATKRLVRAEQQEALERYLNSAADLQTALFKSRDFANAVSAQAARHGASQASSAG